MINALLRASIVLMLMWPGLVYPQAYPSRPIRLIVPSAPGGSPDINSRELAHEPTKRMGQQVVVENRPDASGSLGYEMLPRATPDGRTFAFISNFITTIPSMYAKLPYDFFRDFEPLIFYFRGIKILTVSPALPELPTLDESGLPGYELAGWAGMAVQRGVPREIVLRPNAEINKELASHAVTKGFAARGIRSACVQGYGALGSADQEPRYQAPIMDA